MLPPSVGAQFPSPGASIGALCHSEAIPHQNPPQHEEGTSFGGPTVTAKTETVAQATLLAPQPALTEEAHRELLFKAIQLDDVDNAEAIAKAHPELFEDFNAQGAYKPSPIIEAIRHKKPKMIELFAPLYPHVKDEYNTARFLEEAVDKNLPEIVPLLRRLNFEFCNYPYSKLAHLVGKAIMSDNMPMAKVLQENGVILDDAWLSNGNTLATQAAETRDIKTIRALGNLGVNFNVQDHFHWMPLAYAIKNHDEGMIETLFQLKADVNHPSVSNVSDTPLQVAQWYGNQTITDLLIRLGARRPIQKSASSS